MTKFVEKKENFDMYYKTITLYCYMYYKKLAFVDYSSVRLYNAVFYWFAVTLPICRFAPKMPDEFGNIRNGGTQLRMVFSLAFRIKINFLFAFLKESRRKERDVLD